MIGGSTVSFLLYCVLVGVVSYFPHGVSADSCTNFDSNMGATFDLTDLQR